MYDDWSSNNSANYKFDEGISMEGLQMKVNSYGAVLQHKDKVLMTDLVWNGFVAAVYEFADSEKVFWLERPLKLMAVSDEPFEDGGQAIEWCLEQIK